MPSGFKIVGDSGVVQVDDNFYNLTYIGKVEATFNSTGALVVSMEKPGILITAIKSSTPVAVDRVSEDPVLVNYYRYYFYGTPNTSFTMYQFRQTTTGDTPNGNLMVYNASGQPTFNSNSKVMKVVGVYDLPNNSLEVYPLTVNVGRTGEFAAVLTQGRRFAPFTGQDESWVYTEGVTITPTGAVTGEVLIKTIPFGGIIFDTYGGGQLMLIDVAGL